ncbi:hypothetical protein [Streptomyces naganishii]|uniref:Uncharacterized protein n=1 Tax=Streptomyces naganishii JCM 4654 TaxID=1306179 RepID=A0A919CWE7_9ACTN|nr:hypothetical protein [Streptomyces naganishii]GHD91892.1 hypothetical protein GCM10010508_42460 [Streptomyces naganishii JCM 4654]
MSERTEVDPRAVDFGCGARLPSGGSARPRAARSTHPAARSADGNRLLLFDGTWRRVETLRVRSLFG